MVERFRFDDFIEKYGDERTAERISKVWQLFTQGYNLKTLTAEVKRGLMKRNGINQIIYVRAIPFISMCKHHFLPFYGECTIAYFPDEYILGLSKFSKVVSYFSKRFQLQEELTVDIGDYLKSILRCPVAVYMKASHTCQLVKGLKGEMETQYLAGRWTKALKDELILKL